MVTELDKLKSAKEYMQKLAEGIDPLAKKELPNDTVLNNVHLSRCFFYVADVLGKVINNGGRVSRSITPFFITKEERSCVPVSNKCVSISEFVNTINEVVKEKGRRKLTTTAVTGWLVEQGLLRVEYNSRGKSQKVITDKSSRIGIMSIIKEGQYGAYTIILYNRQAQQFLLDNLFSIVS